MKRAPSPTLEDVARATGVSTATISRVLNSPDKVAKSTRDKVKSAVDALGYTPHFGGRALASQRTNTIGAIIPTMANAMFANGLQAFQEALAESGVTLLVASTGYDSLEEFHQIRTLIAQGADGLLLIGQERPTETKEFLRKRQIPHVIAWSLSDDPNDIYVGFDNFKAAQMATTAALDLGHRKIANLSGITAGNDRARARQDGVRAAINACPGATLTTVAEAAYLINDARAGLSEILSHPDKPTALVCGSDVLAAGAMVELRNRGISVPDDLSVIGLDDIGLATVVTPPLTTIRVPQVEMGRAAAEVLLAVFSGETTPQSRSFETKLIMRESLTPPRASPS